MLQMPATVEIALIENYVAFFEQITYVLLQISALEAFVFWKILLIDMGTQLSATYRKQSWTL